MPGAQNSKRAVRGRPFEPGKSGNPGGRPKGLAARIREVAPADRLADYYVAIWTRDEASLTEIGITLEEVTLAERNKAAEWLTERGYGKAPAYAPVEGGDPLDRDAIDAGLEDVVDELAARRETAGTGTAEGGAVADTGTA